MFLCDDNESVLVAHRFHDSRFVERLDGGAVEDGDADLIGGQLLRNFECAW